MTPNTFGGHGVGVWVGVGVWGLGLGVELGSGLDVALPSMPTPKNIRKTAHNP